MKPDSKNLSFFERTCASSEEPTLFQDIYTPIAHSRNLSSFGGTCAPSGKTWSSSGRLGLVPENVYTLQKNLRLFRETCAPSAKPALLGGNLHPFGSLSPLQKKPAPLRQNPRLLGETCAPSGASHTLLQTQDLWHCPRPLEHRRGRRGAGFRCVGPATKHMARPERRSFFFRKCLN